MKLIKYFVFAICLFPVILKAEGGSVYSRMGIGELNTTMSARRMGLGGLGTAVFDRDFLSAVNPAAWAKLNLTRFETGVNFQQLSISSSDGSANHSLTGFSGAIVGVPAERDLGLSFAGGLVPVSSIDYTIMDNGQAGGYSFTRKYQGKGNFSKLFVGGSYTTPLDITVGATFDYYIGKIQNYSNVEFTNSTFSTSEFEKIYKTAGIGGTFGLITNDFSKLLGIGGISNLRLGLAVSTSSQFNADTTYYSYYASGQDTLAYGKSESELPMRLSAGLSFNYSSFQFNIDYMYQDWNKYRFGNLSAANLRPLQKVSAGFEYRNPEQGDAGFFQKAILRGGLSYEQTQYKMFGEGINEYGV
ncbi:MAG: hypothetical protein ACM3Q2_07010, partial [Syntrophothermus sp.]